jgi:hypothetical protein
MTTGERRGDTWWAWPVFGRWILVNSIAYVVIPIAGALLQTLASSGTKDLVNDHRAIAVVVVAVVGAGVQGTLWGRWQWRVMRRRVATLPRHRWVVSTIVPVFAVWLLVLAPSAVDTSTTSRCSRSRCTGHGCSGSPHPW